MKNDKRAARRKIEASIRFDDGYAVGWDMHRCGQSLGSVIDAENRNGLSHIASMSKGWHARNAASELLQ